MIVLYILGGLLGFAGLILLLPVSVRLSFDGDFEYKIKIAFVPLNLNKKEKDKLKKDTEKAAEKTEKKEKSFFLRLKDKKGFTGAVKELFVFLKDALVPFKKLLRFVKINDVRLNVSVVGEDAAETAVDYGTACAAVYPLLSFIESFANIKYKKVDIKADFEGKESNFSASLKIKTNSIFLLIFAIGIFKEYKKFSVRNGL